MEGEQEEERSRKTATAPSILLPNPRLKLCAELGITIVINDEMGACARALRYAI